MNPFAGKDDKLIISALGYSQFPITWNLDMPCWLLDILSLRADHGSAHTFYVTHHTLALRFYTPLFWVRHASFIMEKIT